MSNSYSQSRASCDNVYSIRKRSTIKKDIKIPKASSLEMNNEEILKNS